MIMGYDGAFFGRILPAAERDMRKLDIASKPATCWELEKEEGMKEGENCLLVTASAGRPGRQTRHKVFLLASHESRWFEEARMIETGPYFSHFDCNDCFSIVLDKGQNVPIMRHCAFEYRDVLLLRVFCRRPRPRPVGLCLIAS